MRLTDSQQATLSRATTILQEFLSGTALLAAHLIVACMDGKPSTTESTEQHFGPNQQGDQVETPLLATTQPSREPRWPLPPSSHPTDEWDLFYTRHHPPGS